MNFLHDLQIIKGSSQADSINHVTIFSPCEAFISSIYGFINAQILQISSIEFFFPFFFRVMKWAYNINKQKRMKE